MKVILRSSDPSIIAFASALLQGEGIAAFVQDVHLSLSQFRQRPSQYIMVTDTDCDHALTVLADNGIAPDT